MATLQSSGIGSGLDVGNLVARLVAAERAPAQNRISAAQASSQSRLSAYGTFKAGLSQLKDGLGKLSASNTFGAFKVTSSSETALSATASTAAAPGRYEVEVLATARADKRASSSFASASSVVGTGTVTLATGTASFSVTLAPGSDTLAHLRDAINAAPDNTGVSASLVNEGGGTRLLLTARNTGTAHALSVTTSLFTTSVQQPAANARIKIDGFEFTGSANTFDTAIDGLTVVAREAAPGTLHTLTVAADSSAAKTAAEAFVRGFNVFHASVATLTRYDAASRSGGALLGDAMVRSASQQVRGSLTQSLPGNAFGTLSRIGIGLQADGSLKLDSAKFEATLASDPAAVQALLAGEGGVAGRVGAVVQGYLDPDGRIETATDAVQSQLDDLKDRQQRLDDRMEAVERRYLAQFTALDSLVSQLQATSSYLTQQLSSLDF